MEGDCQIDAGPFSKFNFIHTFGSSKKHIRNSLYLAVQVSVEVHFSQIVKVSIFEDFDDIKLGASSFTL